MGDGGRISMGSSELYFTRIGSAAVDPESKGLAAQALSLFAQARRRGRAFRSGRKTW